jgi:RNA polymerase sigma factor (TIGR02999 family)
VGKLTKRQRPLSPDSRPRGAELESLATLAYDELRRMARRLLGRENPGHTLQPTALVHEVYLRLAGRPEIAWYGRAHFLAAASAEMRRILVDHARSHGARRRSGRPKRVTLDEGMLAVPDRTLEILSLNEALATLKSRSLRQSRVAEMRLFGGMHVTEVAAALQVSERTVKDDWRMARAWLTRALRYGGRPSVGNITSG